MDAHAFFRSWETSRKPRWVLWARLVCLTPGFQLILSLRFQRWLTRVPVLGPSMRRIVWYLTTMAFGCDIDPMAEIGPGLYMPHPTGIVIGGGITLGANVAILQNVTLGRGRRDIPTSPVIGDGVEIGCGACVLGAITVGAGAIIGANSVVTKDVPAGAIAVGSPARILWRQGAMDAAK